MAPVWGPSLASLPSLEVAQPSALVEAASPSWPLADSDTTEAAHAIGYMLPSSQY